MKEAIEQILSELNNLKASTQKEVEEARIRFLGKKGEVTALMEEFRTVAPELKREYGQKLNELKKAAAAKIEELKEKVQAKQNELARTKNSNDLRKRLADIQIVFETIKPESILSKDNDEIAKTDSQLKKTSADLDQLSKDIASEQIEDMKEKSGHNWTICYQICYQISWKICYQISWKICYQIQKSVQFSNN